MDPEVFTLYTIYMHDKNEMKIEKKAPPPKIRVNNCNGLKKKLVRTAW
jgi:hypothetical protein